MDLTAIFGTSYFPELFCCVFWQDCYHNFLEVWSEEYLFSWPSDNICIIIFPSILTTLQAFLFELLWKVSEAPSEKQEGINCV